MSGEPEHSPGLRVVVRRTGGFAGIVRVWSLAEADLPADEAARLRSLAAAADEACAPGRGEAAAPVRDGFDLELVIERDGRRRTLRVTERGAVGSVRALVELVRLSGAGGGGRDEGPGSPG